MVSRPKKRIKDTATTEAPADAAGAQTVTPSSRPGWVKPGALVHHQTTEAIFVLRSLQQKRGTEALFLLDRQITPSTAAGEAEPKLPPNLIRAPLDECERATLAQFLEPRVVRLDGEPLLIPVGKGYVQVVDRGQDSERLELSPAWLAARSLATFMNGEVVEIDDPSPFGLLPLPEDSEGDVLPVELLDVAADGDAEGVKRLPVPSDAIPPAPGLDFDSATQPRQTGLDPELEDLAIEPVPAATGDEKPFHQRELLLWEPLGADVVLEEQPPVGG